MARFRDWTDRLKCYCVHATLVVMSWLGRFLRVVAACQKNINGPMDAHPFEQERPQLDLAKVVIALDFEGLLIEHSRYRRKDMTRLNVPATSKSFWEKVQFWCEVGYFYRRKRHYD